MVHLYENKSSVVAAISRTSVSSVPSRSDIYHGCVLTRFKSAPCEQCRWESQQCTGSLSIQPKLTHTHRCVSRDISELQGRLWLQVASSVRLSHLLDLSLPVPSALHRERRARYIRRCWRSSDADHTRGAWTGTRARRRDRVTIFAGAAWGGTHSPVDAREVIKRWGGRMAVLPPARGIRSSNPRAG
jgi:hypothetical protein